jgi:hypothetical protein
MTATTSTHTSPVSHATTTYSSATSPAGNHVTRRSLLRTAAVATLLAAIAVEAFTAIVRGAGVRLAIDDPSGHAGTAIGFGACAFTLVLCMVPGVALAYAVRRWAARPARIWLVSTGVLVAASFVPDLVEPSTSAATRVTLMGAHLIAAAVIVPMIARRLPASR